MQGGLFKKATKFNLGLLHKRTCIYNSKEKSFAIDFYSHSYCMNKYLLQHKQDMHEKTENKHDYDENVRKEFDPLGNNLDFDRKRFYGFILQRYYQ